MTSGPAPSLWDLVLVAGEPPASVRVEAEVAQSGQGGVALGGRRLHSRHEPMVEAERAARAIQVHDRDQLVVFFGAGLGYVVRRFLETRENPCLWFEPFEALLRLALATVDVAQFLESGRLRAVQGMPGEDMLDELFRGRANRDIVFYAHQAAYSAEPTYRLLQIRVEDYLNRKSVNMATLARFDREWTRNLCANIPHLLLARPVRELFDTAPGALALVCGAGPSLSDSMDDIRKLRRGAVLVAVDTAVRPLNLAGLDPDFIVTVDPQALNRHYLEDYVGGARFLVDPTTSTHSLRRLPSERVYYSASPFPLARLFFDEVAGHPGEVAFGGSVSTNAYDFALRLGCSRVALFGQDFAFTKGLAHARGAVLEERWNFQEARLRRRELHNYRQLSALPERRLPRSGGGSVPTNDKLLIFHGWFSRRIPADHARGVQVYNGTPGGALLPGAESALPSVGPPPVLTISGGRPRIQGARERLLARLGRLLEDARTVQSVAADGLAAARELLDVCRTQPTTEGRYERALARVDRQDALLQERTATSEVVSSLMQGAIFRITDGLGEQSDPPGAGGGLSVARVRAAEKTVALYEAFAEAAGLLIRLVGRTCAVLASESDA